MTSFPNRLAALSMLLASIVIAPAQGQTPAAETSSEVPALTAFHEVIYPLWHEAWPNKNLGLMRELLPQVEKGVAAIKTAELPGILRDKQGAWQQGVATLDAAASKLKSSLEAKEEQGALDAAEELHASFEQLARLTHPVMKELDAFHVVLYDVYHKILPGKKLDEMTAAAGELASRCVALQSAQVPKRFMAKEAQLKKGFAELCDATAALKTAAAGTDTAAIASAVEVVHTRYQATEELFRQ